ncbi:AAA family ATPase [Ensifer sp. ENS12]|uniref:AAA family ATPase n=1 Tax=Ensifer sp. ENS12 TaxID=2854774 RepID=UPI001C45FC42|nr:AAA family ATPase [Ensifer sp. ENS12]MBV7522579.1 AAA family ATPase [Ensifer sp. ENS12]
MASLIGVCGFTGAGKSTALEIIREKAGGDRIYLGHAIYTALAERGLPRTAGNERQIREELRAADAAALARLNAPAIARCLATGQHALIDAVMSLAEFEFLVGHMSCPVHLVHVDANFEIRSSRLKERPERSMTPHEVELRDRLELEKLKIDQVFRSATAQIPNESSIEEFAQSLATFLERAGL